MAEGKKRMTRRVTFDCGTDLFARLVQYSRDNDRKVSAAIRRILAEKLGQ